MFYAEQHGVNLFSSRLYYPAPGVSLAELAPYRRAVSPDGDVCAMAVDLSEDIEALREISRKSGRPRIGWLCICAPFELIHAAGLDSFFVRGRGEFEKESSAHLSVFACSHLRKTLNEAIRGSISLDGVMGVASCEGMRRHFEIWTRSARPRFAGLMDMPRVDSPASRHYLCQKIESAAREIERAYDVRLTKRSIAKAVRDLNHLRAALRRLDGLRAARPGAISNRDFYELVLLAMESPPAAASAVVDSACDRISRSRSKKEPAILLAISGNIVDDIAVFKAFDDVGAIAVFDDLCIGNRFFSVLDMDAASPLESVANRIFDSFTCARSLNEKSKLKQFASEAKKRGSTAIALVSQINCDAALIEQAKIAQEAERLGFKVLSVLLDGGLRSYGIREKFKEFAEMIA